MSRALWIVQVLLALVYLLAGGAKLVLPLEAMAGPVTLPGPLLRFIGVCEVLGALGLVFPGLLRIRPGLTPLAAVGLLIIMLGAIVVGIMGIGVSAGIAPTIVGLLLLFVIYGRTKLAPQTGK